MTLTATNYRAALWAVTKVIATILWVTIRICLIIIIAVGVGVLRGAMRSRPPSQHG